MGQTDVSALHLKIQDAEEKIKFLENQLSAQIAKTDKQLPTDPSNGIDPAKFKELYFKLSQDHMNNNIDHANELCA